MLGLNRVINAVGQGGFYEERFYSGYKNIYNFVFDCGTANKQALFSDLIDKKNYKHIDLLCISHFDNDHVSLLPNFLRGRHLDTIILPLVTDDVEFGVLLDIGSYSDETNSGDDIDDDFLNRIYNQYMMIYNTEEYINSIIDGELKRIINISPDRYKTDNVNFESISIDILPKKSTQLSGCKFHSTQLFDKWIFRPINISFADSSCSLKRDFIDRLFKLLDSSDNYKNKYMSTNIKTLIGDAVRDKNLICLIRKAYHAVYNGSHKKMNDYSMALYSGLLYNKNPDIYVTYFKRRKYNAPHNIQKHMGIHHNRHYINATATQKAGCLYLGDYNAKDYYAVLDHYFRHYARDYILSLQIPHHGSIENWNNQLLGWAEDFFVSFGSNRYHHPSSHVLSDIMSNNKRVFEITHLKRSTLNYSIGMKSIN